MTSQEQFEQEYAEHKRRENLHTAARRYLDFRQTGDSGLGHQYIGVHPETELKKALNGQS